MASRSEFVAQPERILSLHESCSCWGPTGAMGRPSPRIQRVGANSTYENINTAVEGGSRSLGSKLTINQLQSVKASFRGGALSDITNIATGQATQINSNKPLKPHHSLQPLASAPPQPPLGTEERGSTLEVTNAQSAQEYAPDILNQLFREELAAAPRPNYMDLQTDITPKMRAILIDWLIEVHAKYRLCPETLYLAVNLIDRYLLKTPVMRKRLQLVGVAAMFIASKFEDIKPPELHEWVYITDNAYKKDDLLVMECTMLTALDFKIVVPTAAHFFEALQNANGCDAAHREVAQYLLHLALLDVRMLQYTPSHMVAASLLLSNELLKRQHVWPAAIAEQSRHTEPVLRSCAEDLRRLFEADRAGAGQQLAVQKKFSTALHCAVAQMKF